MKFSLNTSLALGRPWRKNIASGCLGDYYGEATGKPNIDR